MRERHRAQRVQDEVTARLDGARSPHAVVTPVGEDRPTVAGRSTARDNAEGTTPTSQGATTPGMINVSGDRGWEPHSDTWTNRYGLATRAKALVAGAAFQVLID